MCPNQVGQAKYFFIVKYFSGLERGAGARLCPRRRSDPPETSTGPGARATSATADTGGRTAGRGCARTAAGRGRRPSMWRPWRRPRGRVCRCTPRRCSLCGGAGPRWSWRSARPPWCWWTSAAAPRTEAACPTPRATQVGSITQCHACHVQCNVMSRGEVLTARCRGQWTAHRCSCIYTRRHGAVDNIDIAALPRTTGPADTVLWH